MTAWEAHRREVVALIAAAEGLEGDALAELVREILGSQPGTKVVLRTFEQNKWQGPAFETYRRKVLLERFAERAPPSADILEAFRAIRKASQPLRLLLRPSFQVQATPACRRRRCHRQRMLSV